MHNYFIILFQYHSLAHKMIDVLRKFISLSHKVALAATIRQFSTKICSFRKVVFKQKVPSTKLMWHTIGKLII